MSTRTENLVATGIARAFDRLPPHSIEAEMCCVASAMLDRDVFEELKVLIDRSAFYQADHQVIWDVIVEQHAKGRPVDAILVREELKKRHLLDEVGGVPYLAQILDSVPSAAHGLHYAKIVARTAKQRRLITAANDLLRDCYAPFQEDEQVDEIARKMERETIAVRELGFSESIQTIEEIVTRVIESKMDTTQTTRIKTGLADLDDLCGGLPIGGLTYIAGRPGMGKSQLVRQICNNVSAGGVAGGLVAIEENKQKIGENQIANIGGIPNSEIVYNRMSDDQWARAVGVPATLKGRPFYIDDRQVRLSEVETVIRRMVRRYRCRIIAVDHIHLINAETHPGTPREQEISKISNTLKSLFKELSVAGICAAQMNRGGAMDTEAPPELHHLRGSGTLEQDGDLIIQLHRQDYYEWKKQGRNFTPDHKLTAFVNKNKGGPVGSRDLYFDGDSQTVSDWNEGCGPNDAPVPASMFQL